MPWIGRKRIAFVPLHRPNAHPPDEPVPADWPADILKRVLFEPDSRTGADRSLRALIHAMSSGRADLDAVVMPMEVLDQQDVPPNALEGKLGSALRDQGFHAAALVMLGQPPTGQGEEGGFWARFDRSEGVGVWAMELMHVLTGFTDLYTFNAGNVPNNMDAFDEMACSCATHPTAYTKAALNWLDESAIAQHIGVAAEYDLHAIGLIQPPPSGRWAAVRIGSQVPYLMVEARQMVDQFERGIPDQGVIVYRIQTTDPMGHAQNETAPIKLLTAKPPATPGQPQSPFALKVDESFTAENGVTVRVIRALEGGFSVRIEDPSQHVVDRSMQYGTPAATGAPAAWVNPGLNVQIIAYRDTSGKLHELWRDLQGGSGTTDLTGNAGAPGAVGNPFAYVDTARNTEILLFRTSDGGIHSLVWSLGQVGHDNLSGVAGTPAATGDAVGYYAAATDTHHVIHPTSGGHLWELWWNGVQPVQGGGDLIGSASPPAPPVKGQPSAFVGSGGLNNVIYRGQDNHIRRLFWDTGAVSQEDLSGFAGTPPAAGDPVAYYTAHDDAHQIVYVGTDGHVWELFWAGNAPVQGWDLSAPSGAPTPAGTPAAYYFAGENTKHVIYHSADGRLHELWWTPGGGIPAHEDLSFAYATPLAADRPAAFAFEPNKTQHVAYRGNDGHIYEVIW
jgi:hypothetical protein